jgi:hypothetical protein
MRQAPTARRNTGWAPALGLAMMAGCQLGPGPAHKFVDGPESPDLARTLSGTLVINQGWDSAEPDGPRLVAVALPELEQTVLRRSAKDNEPAVWAVSGPDQEGRVAFIEGNYAVPGRGSHSVRVIRADGSGEEEIFRRPGKVLWDNAIGRSLALSPTGGRIACLGALSGAQMPGALLQTGPLEVWQIASKTRRPLSVTALDDGLSWFPDGQRLAYVELMTRKDLEPEIQSRLKDDPAFLKGVEDWDRLPVVQILNVETGEKRFLQVGWSPVVSSDGRAVLVRWGRTLAVDARSRSARPVRWPGKSGNPVALVDGDKVIYMGLPTAGTEPRRSQRGSFKSGSPMLSVKAAVLDSRRFQTLAPYIDFRDTFSFGPFKNPKPGRVPRELESPTAPGGRESD